MPSFAWGEKGGRFENGESEPHYAEQNGGAKSAHENQGSNF